MKIGDAMTREQIEKRLRRLAKVAGEGILSLPRSVFLDKAGRSLRSVEKGLLDLADKLSFKTLYAVAFGEDLCNGDSAFYAPENMKLSMIEMDLMETEGDQSLAFDALLKNWIRSAGAEPDGEQPVGFWIIEQSTRDAAVAVWDSEPGNDGDTYACNRAAKSICMGQHIKAIMRPGWELSTCGISYDPKKAKSGK